MAPYDLKPVHYGGFSYLAMSKQQFFEVPYRLLHEAIDQAVDIVVVSTDTWNRNIDKIGMIYKRIDEEGVTLYA